MPTVALKKIETGMVLATDTEDSNGVTLLKKGIPLTEAHINILKNRGITHIDIVSDQSDIPKKAPVAASPKLMEQADTEAHFHFKHVDQAHPLYVELIKHWKDLYLYRESNQK